MQAGELEDVMELRQAQQSDESGCRSRCVMGKMRRSYVLLQIWMGDVAAWMNQ